MNNHVFAIYVGDLNLYREDLIYDRETGTLIGYTDLGEVNNHLRAFEQSVAGNFKECREPAKSMLSFMVKGPFKIPLCPPQSQVGIPYFHYFGRL